MASNLNLMKDVPPEIIILSDDDSSSDTETIIFENDVQSISLHDMQLAPLDTDNISCHKFHSENIKDYNSIEKYLSSVENNTISNNISLKNKSDAIDVTLKDENTYLSPEKNYGAENKLSIISETENKQSTNIKKLSDNVLSPVPEESNSTKSFSFKTPPKFYINSLKFHSTPNLSPKTINEPNKFLELQNLTNDVNSVEKENFCFPLDTSAQVNTMLIAWPTEKNSDNNKKSKKNKKSLSKKGHSLCVADYRYVSRKSRKRKKSGSKDSKNSHADNYTSLSTSESEHCNKKIRKAILSDNKTKVSSEENQVKLSEETNKIHASQKENHLSYTDCDKNETLMNNVSFQAETNLTENLNKKLELFCSSDDNIQINLSSDNEIISKNQRKHSYEELYKKTEKCREECKLLEKQENECRVKWQEIKAKLKEKKEILDDFQLQLKNAKEKEEIALLEQLKLKAKKKLICCKQLSNLLQGKQHKMQTIMSHLREKEKHEFSELNEIEKKLTILKTSDENANTLISMASQSADSNEKNIAYEEEMPDLLCNLKNFYPEIEKCLSDNEVKYFQRKDADVQTANNINSDDNKDTNKADLMKKNHETSSVQKNMYIQKEKGKKRENSSFKIGKQGKEKAMTKQVKNSDYFKVKSSQKDKNYLDKKLDNCNIPHTQKYTHKIGDQTLNSLHSKVNSEKLNIGADLILNGDKNSDFGLLHSKHSTKQNECDLNVKISSSSDLLLYDLLQTTSKLQYSKPKESSKEEKIQKFDEVKSRKVALETQSQILAQKNLSEHSVQNISTIRLEENNYCSQNTSNSFLINPEANILNSANAYSAHEMNDVSSQYDKILSGSKEQIINEKNQNFELSDISESTNITKNIPLPEFGKEKHLVIPKNNMKPVHNQSTKQANLYKLKLQTISSEQNSTDHSYCHTTFKDLLETSNLKILPILVVLESCNSVTSLFLQNNNKQILQYLALNISRKHIYTLRMYLKYYKKQNIFRVALMDSLIYLMDALLWKKYNMFVDLSDDVLFAKVLNLVRILHVLYRFLILDHSDFVVPYHMVPDTWKSWLVCYLHLKMSTTGSTEGKSINDNLSELFQNMKKQVEREDNNNAIPNKSESTNNVICVVCKKPSELACAACQKVSYCGIECQAKDWNHHQNYCNFIT